jgi:predicted porin
MNKKLLAAAVAAAVVAAPAAFAESTVYGKFHTSVDMVDMETGGASTVDNWQVNSRASRLGFKGSEDLGNGLKAIYQVEFGISTDGGPAQTNQNAPARRSPVDNHRNTFIGLAGDWGTFIVGRHDTPMKMAFYATGNELLGDSIIDMNAGASPIGVFQEVRASNAIAYVSPNFSGFTVAAAVVPGEEGVTAAGTEADGLADHYSVGVMWKGMGFKFGAGFETLENQAGGVAPGAANQDMDTWQIGGSYTFGAFSVGAQYQDTSDAGFVANTDYTAWALTGKATFGNNAIALAYTTSETDPAGVASTDTDGWGISAEHNFSKRTKVYAAYAMGETDAPGTATDMDDDRFSLGMIHSF